METWHSMLGTSILISCIPDCLIMWVLVFLLVPETARLSLEQIEYHFLSGRMAWKTAITRNKEIVRGETVDHTKEEGYKA